MLGVETPKTLFPRGLLHSSVVAFLVVQKFALGVPYYCLEQHIKDQEVELDRGTMCRYTDEAGGALGATIVNAMWQNAISNACIISTDATSGLVQPEKSKNGLRQSCKKGHFFTAVVDCESVLFAYTEKHTQDFVKKLFGGFRFQLAFPQVERAALGKQASSPSIQLKFLSVCTVSVCVAELVLRTRMWNTRISVLSMRLETIDDAARARR